MQMQRNSGKPTLSHVAFRNQTSINLCPLLLPKLTLLISFEDNNIASYLSGYFSFQYSPPKSLLMDTEAQRTKPQKGIDRCLHFNRESSFQAIMNILIGNSALN